MLGIECVLQEPKEQIQSCSTAESFTVNLKNNFEFLSINFLWISLSFAHYGSEVLKKENRRGIREDDKQAWNESLVIK